MKILGTGLSGLVGSRIVELLEDKYDFDSSIEDIRDKKLIQDRIKASDASVLLHLAAKADVDGCEKDKEFGENGDAWKINVVGTENIVQACFQTNKKLIYISTDFVFDGKKDDGYIEEDIPNPINWYGKTKYEGEKAVQNSGADFIIVRIAYPYRTVYPIKKDFVRVLIEKLKNGESLSMVTDHVMTPTFVDDIANVLDILVQKNENGIFHVVGSQFISPYDCAVKIAKNFGFDKSLISKTTREEYFENRATRPFYLGLKNVKIGELKIKMKTLEEGLKELIK